MTITVLAETVIDFRSGGSASYSSSAFAVPSGTDCLVVDILARGFSSSGICTIDTITHNGQALTVAHDNAAAGFDRVNSYIAYRRVPAIGTFALAFTFDLQTRGAVARVQALAGVKQTGSPIGQIQAQRSATAATDTVGLGLTPAATADSMLCAALGITSATTLTTWTGAGFVEQDTDTYTGGGNLAATFRRRLNAPASANTARAKFGASDTNIGGLLYEILAEPTGVDVSGDIDFTLAMSGSVSGPSSAKQGDAAYYSGDAAWTDVWVLQPDFAGVDRRIHSVGPATAPNMTLDQVAAGTYAANCFRLRTRLTTGDLVIETLPGSQSTSPTVLAFSYGPAGAAAYVNGTPSLASPEAGIGGTVDVGAGGEAIGGHAASSPAPYTGKIARHMRFRGQMSAAQIALLSRSVLDPGSIWGVGQEDDAQDANQSPVALPDVIRPNGRPLVRFTPRVIDPNGVPPDITAVTQPVHGSVSINGNELVLILEPGWVGQDGFTYTATDSGGKSSTARVVVEQLRPALKTLGDSITVASGGSITFDPRVNDIGAGALRTLSASTPANGTAEVLADGRIRYRPDTGFSGADSFTYVVADDFGQASALVAITVTATSFIRASDDSKNTRKGTPVEIDVLANDQASADYLPIVVKPGSITTPSPSGTATLQPNGKVLYTPASGYEGDATFEYSIKPSSLSLPTDTGLVTVRISNASATKWWKDKVLRSGRQWASGPGYFKKDWKRYGREVAAPDAFTDTNFGDRDAKIATWELCAGGPEEDYDRIITGSQFDWVGGGRTGWNIIWGEFTANTMWMGFVCDLIPKIYNTDTGSQQIWDDIIAGQRDKWFIGMGRRIKKNCQAKGVDMKWLLLRPFHEMNDSNFYAIRANNKDKWKRANERIYDKMREGAGFDLRIGFSPGRLSEWPKGQSLGHVSTWMPANTDFITTSFHPARQHSVRSEYLKLINGGGDNYGIAKFAEYAYSLGKPIAFLEWNPKNDNNINADEIFDWFYNEFLYPNRENLLCETLFRPESLNETLAGVPEGVRAAGGADAWIRGAKYFKEKWGGTKISE